MKKKAKAKSAKQATRGLLGSMKTYQLVMIMALVVLLASSEVLFTYLLTTYSSEQYGPYIVKYQQGDLSKDSVVATRSYSFEDSAATLELKGNVSANVTPVFSFSEESTLSQYRELDSLVQAFDRVFSNPDAPDWEKTLPDLPVDVTSDLALLPRAKMAVFAKTIQDLGYSLLTKGVFNSHQIEPKAIAVLLGRTQRTPIDQYIQTSNSFVGTADVVERKLISGCITNENLDSYIDADLSLETKALFTEDEIGLMQRILGSIIKANVFFDQDLTAAEQQSAISQVSPVVLEINAGDFILRKDTIVTDQQLRVLSYLASGTSSMTFSTGFAIFIFSLACILVTTYLFMMTVRSSLHLFEFLMAFLLGALVVLASSYFLHPLSMQMSLILKQAIFPVILVPVILTMMTNSHASGFCSAALISALLTVLPNIDGLAFFQLLFTACVAVVLVRFLNKRMDSLFLWFFSVLTSVAIAVVAIFFNYTDLPKGTMLSLLVQAANVTVSVILASVLMPVLEDIMNLPTVFKLHELAFTSSPLLARMQTEMPGTYNHCLEVAILSESACAAIGANALLARVGGLYHDIGKLKHPEFFTENHGIEGSQQVNVPDGLAVAIIKSHVRFGLEMGKEHGLPQEILNIIYNHHGNDVVRYYYNEAVNSAMAQDHPVTVNREDFAYPGNPPSTKEEAVVMLADCFEAMSRSQGVDSYQRYIKVFQKLLSSKLEDGQLESCDLSLRELARIGEVFANSLISSRHSRVSYPTVEKKTT